MFEMQHLKKVVVQLLTDMNASFARGRLCSYKIAFVNISNTVKDKRNSPTIERPQLTKDELSIGGQLFSVVPH